MGGGDRTRTLATIALAAVLALLPAHAGAGDDGEAEKVAAEKKLPPLAIEVAKEVEAFRPRLENLAHWCTGFDLALQRSRIADALLLFDPDNAKARDWLGFEKQQNGTWKPPSARTFVDGKPELLADYAKRRDEAALPLRQKLVPYLERCRDWTTAGVSNRIVRALLDLFPEDAELRRLHGEVEVEGKWLLKESAATPKNRDRIAAAKTEASAEARSEYRSEGDPNGWPVEVVGECLSVLTSKVSKAEAGEVFEAVLASKRLFGKVLQVKAEVPGNTRLVLLVDQKENGHFLDDVTDTTPEIVNKCRKLGAYWLDVHHCVVVRADRAQRLDASVRQVMGRLDGPLVPLEFTSPCIGEGFGAYLTHRLLGTRLTSFTGGDSNYSDESTAREVAQADSDWVVVARKLVDKGFPLDMSTLLGEPLNTMSKDDGLFAFALAAYFLEGRPEDASRFLAAMNRRKPGAVHQALAETCGVDAEGLGARFVRWLHEVPGK